MRQFQDRKEESKAVKNFLKKDYPDVKVKHGNGTAWGWMKVRFNIPRPANCYCSGFTKAGEDYTKVRAEEFGGSCRHCNQEWQKVYAEVGKRVQEFTGRTGEYGGCINFDVDWQE